MNNYNKNSTALRLVQQNEHETPKAACNVFRSSTYADIRMNLRSEAKMLTATGRCLLILGVIGSGILCLVNGFICHALLNDTGFLTVGIEPSTAIAVLVAMCIGSFLLAGVSVFLSLVLFGVAETLRQESKKIK